MANILSSPLPPASILDEPTNNGEAGGDYSLSPFRGVADSARTREYIYDDVLSAARSLPPVANKLHTLSLVNVRYGNEGSFGLKKQKEAILSGKTLSRRIHGTWRLVDNATGDTLDERDSVVAHVPYFTQRGTMIHGGNEYTLSNQLRLRPGIFTRVKANGEIEAHVNVQPGHGVSHRYFLEPEKGVFKVRIGQANIPLISLLKAFGTSDKTLQEAWGPELFQANAKQDNPASLNKLHQKLARRQDAIDNPDITQQQAIMLAVTNMKMDGEVNKQTLGEAYDSLGPEAILAATRKLIAVSRGEQEVDDRDQLAYQSFFGPEDLLSERIKRDYGGARREVLRRASFARNLKGVPSGALSKQLQAAILVSGLGQSLEEVNPLDILDKQTKVSRMGEGGIGSLDAIPEESRGVSPSHLGFIDPVRTPESLKAGVDTYVGSQVKKGRDGRLYSPLIDVKTGKQTYKSPQDLVGATIAFPREMRRDSKRVGGIRGGKLGFYPRSEVDYEVPHMEHVFNALSNLVPMKSGVKAQRLAMGARMSAQALPLVDPEAPLVQSGVPGEEDKSFEELYGEHVGALRAKQGGTVLSVSADEIKVKYGDGATDSLELYNNWPFNRKTFSHNTPAVRPGDTFATGDLLARSNYTDAKGVTALGKNLSTAYVSFRGANFEDAAVISESAAKKLRSEHMYQHSLETAGDDAYKTSLGDYLSLFGGKYGKNILRNMDTDGVVKPGTTVNYEQPLILAAKRVELAKNKVHRKRQPVYGDVSVVWEHQSPGVVTDVHKGPRGATTVLVKSVNEMVMGDKLSGRYGDKAVVAAVVPDDEMPQDKATGKPFEVLLSPLGIVSRTNPSQVVESLLGKIVEKTGKPYKIKDFEDIEDLTEWALEEGRKHGVSSTATIIDPATGRPIKDILAGNRFFMKLHHMAESKGQGRGTEGYTADGQPAKGGEAGSKRISVMDNSALLSHGATAVMKDASLIRGQDVRREFWLPFMQGVSPPSPKIPMVYEKFVNQLRGAGINVVESGTKTHIMALTDKDIDILAGDRALQNAETVRFEKGLEPISGGLFDEKLTGSHHGTRWAMIKLHEPLPNPVMEEPVRRLLGLTENKFRSVLSGKEQLGSLGAGPEAIRSALDKIDVDRAIENARAQIKVGQKTKRDDAVRRLGYLKSAKKLGIHPRDWILTKAPVLPPKFRPVSVMGHKELPLVADANYLYKELMLANDNLKEMSGTVDDTSDERLAAYDALKAVVGLGDPVHPKLREKRVRGLLKHIFGSSPKFGSMQRRLLSTTVDVVGRAVVVPDSNLDMDQVGLPEAKAWDVYKTFVARRLRRRGMPLLRALQNIEDRSPLAREELIKEMSARPVIINRAPVLHRFGMLAAYPQLVKGDALRVSPLTVGGYGMDFDGDSCVGTSICTLTCDTRLIYNDAVSWGAALSNDSYILEIRDMLSQQESVQVLQPGRMDTLLHTPIVNFPRLELLRTSSKGVEFYSVPEGVKVLTYSAKTGKAKFKPVTEFSIHPNLSGYNVQVGRSHFAGVSRDHSLYCYDPGKGELAKTRPEDSLGSLCPIVKRVRTVDPARKLYTEEINMPSPDSPNAVYLPPDEIVTDFDFGWWLGAIVSDGWTDLPKRMTAHYSKIVPELRKKLVSYINSILYIREDRVAAGATSKVRITEHTLENNAIAGKSANTNIYASCLVKFIHYWIEGEPKGALSKRLPSFFPLLPTSCKIGIFCGLLDGDGTVDMQQAKRKKTKTLNCKITTSSSNLKNDVLLLAKYIGVRASVTEDRRGVEGGGSTLAKAVSYIVSFSKPDIIAIKPKLKLTNPDKAAVLAELEDSCKDYTDLVPIDKTLFSQLRKNVASVAGKQLYIWLSTGLGAGRVARSTALQIILAALDQQLLSGVSDERWRKWQHIVAATDVFWAPVVEIEPIPAQTMYDITVPSTEVFAINNGLIIYDTANYQVPVSDEAVREAVELMLPSRNLFSPTDLKSPMHKPTQDYTGGLYAATRGPSKNRPHVFRSVNDMVAAYKRGKIGVDDLVEILT